MSANLIPPPFTINRGKLTRRSFLISTAAIPVAVRATTLGGPTLTSPEEVDLSIAHADGLLKVAIQQGYSPGRVAFWSRLGVRLEASADKLTGAGPEPRTWSIETARFGPEAKVRLLNRRTTDGRRRYRLSLRDVGFGRLSGRRVRFTLTERLVPDEAGAALLSQMKQNPESHGAVIARRLDKLSLKDVPQKRVFTLEIETDLWSLTKDPQSIRWFKLLPRSGIPDTETIAGALKLQHWIDAAPERPVPGRSTAGEGGLGTEAQALQLLIDAGRITSTLRLVFNGQVGFDDRFATRNVLLSFDQTGAWRVAGRSTTLEALAEGLELDEFLLRWQPVGGTPEETPVTLPPPEFIGPLPENSRSREGPVADPGAFEVHGEGLVSESSEDLRVSARNGAPGLRLRLAPDTRPRKVLFRLVAPGTLPEDVLRRDLLRSEATLLTDWAQLNLTGGEEARAGPFTGLRGRLMERVDAPAKADSIDHAATAGTISFGADFTGSANRHWRVMTPVGPLGFRGMAPEDDGAEDADTPITEDPFRQRHGDQVQAVYAWGRDSRGRFGSRRRPRADWIEVNGVLREAAVTLEGADANRLTFAPTFLTLVHTPGDLPPPQTSYIRLAPPDAVQEIAQIDLSDATLVAAQTETLLGLTFRFADFALSLQREGMELVRRNAACRITTDRSPDGGHTPRDTRPVLVVEFPGQHLFEEAFFAPRLQELPDVRIELGDAAYLSMTVDAAGDGGALAASATRVMLTRLPDQDGWVFDPNDRQQVAELLGLVRDVEARKAIRTALRTAKRGAEGGAGPFGSLSDAYAAATADGPLPVDQQVYIGPFVLDPDAMRLALRIWKTQFDDLLAAQATELLNKVRDAAQALYAEAVGLAPVNRSAEMARIATAAESFEGALALEHRLEAQFPSYQLFRTVYRDEMLEAALKPGASDLEILRPERLETVHVDHLRSATAPAPRWMQGAGLTLAGLGELRGAAQKAYLEALSGREPFDMPARARIANPSRLAFRVRCRDGLSVARNAVPTLDTPADARAEEVRARLGFSLADLTRFSDFDLSVMRRAEAVYQPSETGRIDKLSRRRLDLSHGARLDHLGFSSGPEVTSDMRMAEIATSLRDGPGPHETAIEIPARLTLSPDQNAVVIATTTEVPCGVFALPGEADAGIGARLRPAEACTKIAALRAEARVSAPIWSADFLVNEVDPNLRAVHSPDLRPDVFFARSRARLLDDSSAAPGKRLPGAGAPPRGALAPWHLGALQTQTAAITPQDLTDPAPKTSRLARLFGYLSEEKTRIAGLPPGDLRFRAAIDAYARHELVLLSSAWGLPVLGRRTAAGQLVANSGQSEVEPRFQLLDVETGSAFYEPRTLQTVELSLRSLGGTLRHASSFEPFAAAFDSHGAALFDATSIESWQQWTNIGRDIHCEIVYKGFLWPIGMRAALVQVTEREYFIDMLGAIRAVLRQRLFIRVGKAEKLFPALKQPAQGRQFPVERLRNLTTQTPDIVDPSDDAAGTPGTVLPGGRVQLGQGTKGLVFWPRTAKLPAANIRFELDLDGTLTDLPLIFVDNVAANDAATLADLAKYYNALETPDPLDTRQAQLAFDPLMHQRTLDMGGGKRRYAAEREAGSASCETQLWTLCATGLALGTVQPASTGPLRIWARKDTGFKTDSLLAGADQPPFYPAVECARIRARQAERLIGGPLNVPPNTPDPTQDRRFLRAVLDGHYVEYGLPAASGDMAAVEVALKENVAETYLTLLDQLQLGMGARGDQSGGVYRPSGRVVGLSRKRGILTWNTALTPSDALTHADLPSVAPAFEIPSAPAAVDPVPGSLAASMPSLCTDAPAVVIDPKIQQTLDDMRDLYSNLVDGNAKILGLVSIKDLFAFIEKLDPPATGMPKLAEDAQYGAKQVQSAIGQADDAVQAGLAKLDEAVELVRGTVVVPLSEAVHDIEEGWDELDRDIAKFTSNVPSMLVGEVSFAKIFPDLHCTLVAFGDALERAVGAADALEFSLMVSEVFAAGRRFLDALFRAASDPGSRLEAGLRGGVEGILELVRALEEGQFELLLILAREFLDDATHFDRFLRVARFVLDENARASQIDIRVYADAIADAVIDEDSPRPSLPVLITPPMPVPPGGASPDVTAKLQEIAGALQPSNAMLRDVISDIVYFVIERRGAVTLAEVLERDAVIRTGGTIANRLLREARDEGLSRARALLSQLDPPLRDDVARVLDVYEASLDGLDPEAAAGAAAEDSARQRLAAWLMAGFADEWALLRATDKHIRAIVAHLEAGDIGPALTELRALAELYFGPLSGLDDACAEIFTPIQTVAEGLDPNPETGLHAQAVAEVGALRVDLSALDTDLAEAAEALGEVRGTLDGEDLRDQIAALNQPPAEAIRRQALAALTTLSGELETLRGAVGTLDTALAEARTALQEDQRQLSAIATRLRRIAGVGCSVDQLRELEGLHRDLRALITYRQSALINLATQLQTATAQAKTVLENEVVQTAAGLALALDLLDQVLDFEGLAEDAEETLEALKTRLEGVQASLEARANAYAARLARLLARVAGELATLLKTLRGALLVEVDGATEVIPELLRALFGAEVSEAIAAGLKTLDVYIGWLETLERDFTRVAAEDNAAEALAKLNFAPPNSPAFPAIDFFATARAESLWAVAKLEEEVTNYLLGLAEDAALLFREVNAHLVSVLNDAIRKMLRAEIGLSLNLASSQREGAKRSDGPATIVTLYQEVCDLRNALYDTRALDAFGVNDTLLASATGRGAIGSFTPASDTELSPQGDGLAGDVAWLTALSKGADAADGIGLTPSRSDPAFSFLMQFIDEWRQGRPTPVQITENVQELVAQILKGDLFAAIDFNDLRRQIEDYILSLVPTQIDMSYAYGVELGANVRKATMGIFAPGPGSKLTIEAGITIDLGFDDAAINARTVGRLGPFDIKLVGDAFDAITLKFSGAVFTAETGKKSDFKVAYSDYEIGPMLEFVQQFQSYLTSKSDSGFYREIKIAPLGIEAGYILNLGDFSVGAMAISNVGLASAAILPFEDFDARFRASLSTRSSPFTITYTPYGGSGFFAIEANANGILGFEASFEFGGSAVFAFGPLTGKGRLMAGFYVRQSVGDNGQKLTELSATFFVGGSAQIWIFSFAASLSVRLGMVNGDMSGEAIFSFSFSMGLADFEYSIVMFKREAKGFGGQQSAALMPRGFGRTPIRLASMGFDTPDTGPLPDDVPRVDTDTFCQVRSWASYGRYYTQDIAEDIFQ